MMLEMLRQLHGEILERLEDLDRLTASAQPAVDQLMAVRHALTRASRARTMLLEQKVYPYLLTITDEKAAAHVRDLQVEGQAQLAASSRHIGQWSFTTITQGWDAYRDASNIVRATMRRRITAEQTILYPLLTRSTG